jgi:spore photoproduct lyase
MTKEGKEDAAFGLRIEDCVFYRPRPAEHFRPERIILAKGSLKTPRRRAFVESICGAYPAAEVAEQLGTPHSRIDLGVVDSLKLHYLGKRTLVLGEHRSALSLSDESGNTCPNYWHFSPYGFCPYGCTYCYLAGTQGVRFSPTVKIFLNLDEILASIDRVARGIAHPTAFYLGKLQDGLALDALTGYSRILVPFFASHPFARLTLLTKCADVENLLDLDHRGHTILSWSLSPQAVCDRFEQNTPTVSDRILAMKECASAGYAVRAVIMPVIPVPGWQAIYEQFLGVLLKEVPLERITFGGICIYPTAQALMEAKLGRGNAISSALSSASVRSADGRARYALADRIRIYRHLVDHVRRIRPELSVALCLEEKAVFEALGLTSSIGRCNCVL